MQLTTVLGVSTSNTSAGLLSPASGGSWLDWSARTVPVYQQMPICHQAPLYHRQQIPLCRQGLVPDDATVEHSSARRAVISDFSVRPASTSGTVIDDDKDKNDKTSNADGQPGPASDKPSSGHRRVIACESCGVGFAHASSLSRHKAIMHKNYLFQCITCHKSFNRKDGLRRHEAAMHGGRRDGFTCVVCSQLLPTKFELHRHCDAHHSKAKKFPCSHCDKVFVKSSDLIRHGKCHVVDVRSKGEFRCGICDRLFYDKRHLSTHQKVHDEGRAQKCDECGVDFVGKVMLAHHRITCHGKGKFYSCKFCDSELASIGSLKKHYLMRHGVAENVVASSKTNACKDANMYVNTDAECKEITACGKAEKRQTCSESEAEISCSEPEVKSNCSELGAESTCGEYEKGIICNEHAKEMPEDLKDHRHFPGKMTSRWIDRFSMS